MSKGTIIKTVLISGSLCAALWQAAQFMEILSSAKGQPGMPKAIPGLGDFGSGAVSPGVADAMKNQQQLLSRLGVASAGSAAEPTKEMVVFSPDGKRLTPAEQEVLRRAAERNRPRVPAPSSGKSN